MFGKQNRKVFLCTYSNKDLFSSNFHTVNLLLFDYNVRLICNVGHEKCKDT
jgi:hypothetical protein